MYVPIYKQAVVFSNALEKSTLFKRAAIIYNVRNNNYITVEPIFFFILN